MKAVKVRDMVIGNGTPKVCVSIIARNKHEIKKEIALISKKYVDIVEWRLDFFEYHDQLDYVLDILAYIHTLLDDIPIMLTLRTLSQGGNKEIKEDQYTTLLYSVMKSKYVDIVDVEYHNHELQVKKLIHHAHKCKKKVILSFHDFEKTPPCEELIALWKRMQFMGADIVKVAVMPKNYMDVSNIMKASFLMYQKYAKQPIVAIAMSQLGSVSRVCAKQMGSAITFATLHMPNALGQLSAQELKCMLDMLHNINLSNR